MDTGMNIDIRNVVGHYEVYINGEFYCSADTFSEAVKEAYKEIKI